MKATGKTTSAYTTYRRSVLPGTRALQRQCSSCDTVALPGSSMIGSIVHLFPFVRMPDPEPGESAGQLKRMARMRGKNPVARAIHLHHIIPLLLGGRDVDTSILLLIPKKNHLSGHSWLAHQSQMVSTPKGLKVMPENLHKHPASTMCRLAGFKSSRTETC